MDEYQQWRTVLEGRAHTEYHSYKKLNHYFIKTSNKTDTSEYDAAGKVSTAVMNKIASWAAELEE
jgi:hypothetical protein